MAKGKISKRSVDALRPSDRDEYLWDTDLAGFGLKVTPRGRRIYLVQYRLGGRKGRTRRYTIGHHGPLTPEQARTEAKRLLGVVASGKDPSEARDRARKAPTVANAGERFLNEHVRAKLKPKSIEEYERTFKLHILPNIGKLNLTDVSRARVARLHHSMRDKPYAANRTVAFLTKFFNWSEMHGLRPDGSNPCRHIEKYPEKKRERFLSEVEMTRLGSTLAEFEEGEKATPWTVAAIRLLMLTGARLNEILTLKWDYIDLDSRAMHLPDSKTGAKTIYLNAPSLEVLNGIPRVDGNPHVICGQKPGSCLINLQKPWRRIRKKAKLDDVRLHDLRHSFASVGAIGGASLPVIGALLGHSQPQTTARYAHLSADPLKAASDAIGERIAGALAGESKGKVVPLKGDRGE
ncbi:MAG: integrase [Hyphomicrobiales bacterium]|nr:MAG: integrase [Hyphomicrobiales bacterium]